MVSEIPSRVKDSSPPVTTKVRPDKVWGKEVIVGGRTIDVHSRKLREKIDEDVFKTIKGVGYKIELNVD